MTVLTTGRYGFFFFFLADLLYVGFVLVQSASGPGLTAYQLLTLMSVNFLTSFFGDW
jgi:hypothetical protein